DEDQLVGFDVLEGFDLSAWPADSQQINFVGFSDSEVDAQVVLRDVASTTADFINLGMRLGFSRRVGHTLDSRANSAAIGFCADGGEGCRAGVLCPVEEAASPTEVLRVHAQTCGEGRVFEIPVAAVAIE